MGGAESSGNVRKYELIYLWFSLEVSDFFIVGVKRGKDIADSIAKY